MKEYTICRTGQPVCWDTVPSLSIDTLLWSPEVPIRAWAQLCHDDEALYVRLTAVEPHIRAEELPPLGVPCLDSCLEFFFCPIPGDRRYINIEYNPNCCLCMGVGGGPCGGVHISPKPELLSPSAQRTADGWFVTYKVPYALIRTFFPEFSGAPGTQIRANCYKCGNLTVQRHFLSWNPINLPKPSFHCPEYFGTMYFE